MSAHNVLALSHLPPKVISHEVLAGGWNAVVMEKVDISILAHELFISM